MEVMQVIDLTDVEGGVRYLHGGIYGSDIRMSESWQAICIYHGKSHEPDTSCEEVEMNTIDTNQLLIQLRAAATQAQKPAAAQLEQPGAANFSSLLTQSIEKVNDMQQTAGNMTKAFEMGDPNVTLPEVMIAKSKAGLAFEGMVQVRNKMIDAYQEIMRMQV